MGVSLQQWRIRIGTFIQHGHKGKFKPATLTLRRKSLTVPLQVVLILLSGDIESNPGPLTRQASQKSKFDYVNPNEIKDVNSSIEYFNKQFKFMESRISDLESEVTALQDQNMFLNRKCQQLEDQSRRDNLIFYGIKEESDIESWNDCEKKVRSVLKDVVGIKEADKDEVVGIERAHRLSSKKKKTSDQTPRPIIVKFTRWKTKDEICYKARNVFKNEEHKDSGYGVSDDYSTQVRETRKKLIPFLIRKRKELPDKKVFLKYDKLIVDKKQFQYDAESENIREIKYE